MSTKSRTLIWLFLIALGLRLLFVATRGPDLVWPDSKDYHSIAENLLKGNGFVEEGGRRGSRAPGYPLFLAGCYAVGLRDPRAVFAIQAVAGAAMCVFVVMLGRRLFGGDSRAPGMAGWLAAVYPFFVYYTGLMLAESLFMLGFVGYLILIAPKDPDAPPEEDTEALRSEPHLMRFVAAGALAGALTLLRSSFLLFPVFVLPFWLYRADRFGTALKRWALMMVVMALVILPWGLRNRHVFGHFTPTTLQMGESLYEANSPHADGGPAMDRIDWIKERGGVNMGEYENNRFFKDAAVRYIRENPRRFARLALEKLRRFWNVIPNHGPYRRTFYAAVSVCSYVPIVFLAVVGIIWTRARGRTLWLLAAPVLYFSFLHMIFVGSIRYRAPIMPFVILFAGLGWVVFRQRWLRPVQFALSSDAGTAPPKRRRKWLLWAAAVLIVVSGVLVALWRHYVTPERLRLAAQKQLSAIAGGEVDIREVRFGLFRGIVLRGVRIEDVRSETGRPALRVDTVVLQPKWSALLHGDMVLVGMRLEDVQVDAKLDDSGHWPFLDQLQLSGEGTERLPAVFVSRARVRVSGVKNWLGIGSLDLSRLNATIRPVVEDPDLYDAVLWSDDLKLGRPRITTRFSAKSRAVQGTFRFSDLDLTSPVLRELLPASVQRTCNRFAPSKGRLTSETEFAWDPDTEQPLAVSGDAYLRDLWFKYEGFPRGIEQVSVDLSFDERSLHVGRFKGTVGKTVLSGGGGARLRENDELIWEATLRAKGVELDEELYALLPVVARLIWDQIHPAGTVNLSLSMNSDPTEAQPKLRAQVELIDCACAVDGFPVAFDRIRGRLHMDGRRLAMRGIEGRADGAPFSLRDGFIVVESQGPFLAGGEIHDLHIDRPCSELIPSALLIKAPRIVRLAVAKGNIDGNLSVSATVRRDASAGRIVSEGRLVMKKGTFSHPDLPMPLTDVQIAGRYAEGAIQIDGVSANWGEGRLEAPEATISLRSGGAQSIKINGSDFPLNDDLYQVVPASVKRIWDQLRPTAGFANIALSYTRHAGDTGRMHRTITVDFRDGAIKYTGFPYAASGISGRVFFDGMPLKYAELQGAHNDTEIKVGVYEEPLDGVRKTRVVVDGKGVPLDKELRDALPDKYHEWWDAFQPEGFVDVRYVSEHGLDDDGGVFPKYLCDVTGDAVSLNASLPAGLSGVSFAIEQTGPTPSSQARLKGKVHFDAAQIDRYQLDQFDGTLEGEGSNLFMDGLSGNFYGGDLTGTASMASSVDEDGKKNTLFKIALKLSDADAEELARLNEMEGLSGRLNSITDLTIGVGAESSFGAAGALTIRDGHIGDLPGMVSVLNLLSLRGLDAPAFHTLEMNYAIVEGTFHVYELNLLGTIMSLHGAGTVDKEKQMDFTFHMNMALRVNVPGIMPLWDAMKKKVVPITVHGDLDDPEWRMNPLISIARIVQGTLTKLVPGKKAKPEE